MEITCEHAFEGWKKALAQVCKKGRRFVDSNGRVCFEILGMKVTITDTSEVTAPIRFLSSQETWVYPPLEEIEEAMLARKEMPGYAYTYGVRMFNASGVNQIDEYVIPLLKKDKASRRGTIVMYNPSLDTGVHNKNVPGIIMVNCNMINNALHVTGVIRSNDLFFGWPANMHQLSVLQRYIAGKIGCSLGSITTFSISAHVFEDQQEFIEKVV